MDLSILLPFLLFLCLGGIMFVTYRSPVKTRTRDEFLNDLCLYLKGELVPVANSENSFHLNFQYEGLDFVYEDIEGAGFYNKIYSAYLRVKTKSSLTLIFQEPTRQKLISKEVQLASNIIDDGSTQARVKIDIPKSLKGFAVRTNDPLKTNRLLGDAKIADIFNDFQSFDSVGHPFMALSIVEGEVMLEFHPSGTFNPRPLYLQKNIKTLDDYLSKMAFIVEKIKSA
jgi:hypothetical protein